MSSSRVVFASVVLSAFVIAPLAVLGFLAVTAPPGQLADALAPLGLPYATGAVIGILVFGFLAVRGKLTQELPPGTNQQIFLIVTAVSVPAGIILPILLPFDPRLTIVMFFTGLALPIIPALVIQMIQQLGKNA